MQNYKKVAKKYSFLEFFIYFCIIKADKQKIAGSVIGFTCEWTLYYTATTNIDWKCHVRKSLKTIHP